MSVIERGNCPASLDCNSLSPDSFKYGCVNQQYCIYLTRPWHLPYSYQILTDGSGLLEVNFGLAHAPHYAREEYLEEVERAGFINPQTFPIEYFNFDSEGKAYYPNGTRCPAKDIDDIPF